MDNFIDWILLWEIKFHNQERKLECYFTSNKRVNQVLSQQSLTRTPDYRWCKHRGSSKTRFDGEVYSCTGIVKQKPLDRVPLDIV